MAKRTIDTLGGAVGGREPSTASLADYKHSLMLGCFPALNWIDFNHHVTRSWMRTSNSSGVGPDSNMSANCARTCMILGTAA